MSLEKLAEDFAAAENAARADLLLKMNGTDAVALARSLKDLCVDAWGGDTARIFRAAEAGDFLAAYTSSSEVRAYADWIGGHASLLHGEMREALEFLDRAVAGFKSLDQLQTAAYVQVLRLYPLASLNRFEEAINTGVDTRDTLLSGGEIAAVGKVELNMGNLYWLRDQFDEAEKFYRSARMRFLETREEKLLTQCENSLAVVLTARNEFREAEDIYQNALPRAEAAGFDVTVAEIESSLGMLALSQGHYDRALQFLERARRRYSALEMPHRLAATEKEVADCYLELNLASEAAEIYRRIGSSFADSETPFEQAQTLVNHSRALLLMGRADEARQKLSDAGRLFEECGSESGLASVALIEAELGFVEGRFDHAAEMSRVASESFLQIGIIGPSLHARFLEAEARRLGGDLVSAEETAKAALAESERNGLPQIEWRLRTALGMTHLALGKLDLAEKEFSAAINLIESLREPLPAEEFRASFFNDKVEPYTGLAGLCLADGGRDRVAEAFEHIEHSRGRTLLELIDPVAALLGHEPRTDFETGALKRIDELRDELNWYYSRLNRPASLSAASPSHMAEMELELRKREDETSEMLRQISSSRGRDSVRDSSSFSLERFQTALPEGSIFLEYAAFRGQIGAFLVTPRDIKFVGKLAPENEVIDRLGKLRFQIDALRNGSSGIRRHLYELTLRTRRQLSALYDSLIRPIEADIGLSRVIIAPHGVLHYVPFPALFDGMSYLIEDREVVLAPSAGAWQAVASRLSRKPNTAVLLSVPDDQISAVTDEVDEISKLFSESIKLQGPDATTVALKRYASEAEILHLACHGNFRSANPMFSSLSLHDGVFNVRDAASLDLSNCEVAVLSACETGVNRISPGEELLGLMRGFFAAGVPTIVLSKWAVDDEATSSLMKHFYRRMIAGETPSAAMRSAQCDAMRTFPHPFFWASFSVTGRP